MGAPSGLIAEWFAALARLHPLQVAGFVAGSSALEHVVPPYPGDAAVALGAAVGFARDMSFALIFFAANLGGFVGACIMYAFGAWLGRAHPPPNTRRARIVTRVRGLIEPAVSVLRARGVPVLMFSRFMPVGRALVTVAAGYVSMPLRRALPAVAVASVLWNAVLFIVGGIAGANLDRIAVLLSRYNRAAGVVIAVLVVAWIARAVVRRRNAQRAALSPSEAREVESSPDRTDVEAPP